MVFGFVWCVVFDGSVEFFNQWWCDYIGLSFVDFLGIGWMIVIYFVDVFVLGGYWQVLFQVGELGFFEVWLCCSDGIYCWFLICVVFQCDEVGQVVKWYGQNMDIDDCKCVELLFEGEKCLLEMMVSGVLLVLVLEVLCNMVQIFLDGVQCSVVLIDLKYIYVLWDFFLCL